jgi:hypothetical protein
VLTIYNKIEEMKIQFLYRTLISHALAVAERAGMPSMGQLKAHK